VFAWRQVSTVTMIRLKYRSDFEKAVVLNNLERRGMTRTSEGAYNRNILIVDDWNFYWANVGNVKALFNPENGFRLNDAQYVLDCLLTSKNY
jgi:hypothetical protein